MIFLTLKFFTEKNSDKFYKYKTNFNELSEKLQIFNNSGVIIDKTSSISYNDDYASFEKEMIRESVMIEELQADQKLQLEKANQEFNELNQRSNISMYPM